MNTKNVLVHNAALAKAGSETVFREGSCVYVKVLKQNSDFSYKVSVFGKKFDFYSKIPLKNGSSFYAKVLFEGKKVLLQRIPENSKNGLVKFNKDTSTLENQYFSNILNELGFVADGTTIALLQQMRRLGLPFSVETMKKVRAVAEKLKKTSNPKEVSQIAYILESKGIVANGQTVLPFLAEQNNQSEKEDSSNFKEDCSKSFKDFFLRLFNSSNERSLKNPIGILTFFNHLGFNFNSAEQKGNWIKIPFEFQFEVEDMSIDCCEKNNILREGAGFVSCFLDGKTGKCNQACIHFDFSDFSLAFTLVFDLIKLFEIKVFVSNEYKSYLKLSRNLEKNFSSVKISFYSMEDFFQFYVNDDVLNCFTGIV